MNEYHKHTENKNIFFIEEKSFSTRLYRKFTKSRLDDSKKKKSHLKIVRTVVYPVYLIL